MKQVLRKKWQGSATVNNISNSSKYSTNKCSSKSKSTSGTEKPSFPLQSRLPRMRILCGTSHPGFAELIANHLQIKLTKTKVKKFKCLETFVEIPDSVRGQDVYVVQTGSGNINENLMELFLLLQACRIASASRITAVIPYFPYGRQDKTERNRSPISSKLVANLMTVSGAQLIITMDLHAPQIQGFFDIPLIHIFSEPALLQWVQNNIPDYKDSVIVAPDNGAVKRVTSMADRLKTPFALLHKERKVHNEVSKMILVGDIKGKNAIVVDDMADTCGTLCHAAATLTKAGAKKVYTMVTHGIFSGDALEKLNKSSIEVVVVTNTLPQEKNMKNCSKIKTIDISTIFAEAAKRSHNGESIKSLFTKVP